nr:MAG TPA: hypothetical protein [Caudoviricetes sp.]
MTGFEDCLYVKVFCKVVHFLHKIYLFICNILIILNIFIIVFCYHNPRVVGSNPTLATIKKRLLVRSLFFIFGFISERTI